MECIRQEGTQHRTRTETCYFVIILSLLHNCRTAKGNMSSVQQPPWASYEVPTGLSPLSKFRLRPESERGGGGDGEFWSRGMLDWVGGGGSSNNFCCNAALLENPRTIGPCWLRCRGYKPTISWFSVQTMLFVG